MYVELKSIEEEMNKMDYKEKLPRTCEDLRVNIDLIYSTFTHTLIYLFIHTSIIIYCPSICLVICPSTHPTNHPIITIIIHLLLY